MPDREAKSHLVWVVTPHGTEVLILPDPDPDSLALALAAELVKQTGCSLTLS
jgi:hypothetical protein